jgi:hypothetical protein
MYCQLRDVLKGERGNIQRQKGMQKGERKELGEMY